MPFFSAAGAVGAAAVAAKLAPAVAAPEAAGVDPRRASVVAQGREPGVEDGDLKILVFARERKRKE